MRFSLFKKGEFVDQYLNSKRDIAKNLNKELDELVYQKNSHIELEKFLLLFHKASISKRKFKTSSLAMVKLLDFKTLESLYWITTNKIEHDNNRTRESHATYPERQVLKHIKRFSRAKHYSSFWIKNFCIDVFIPRNLLALEIDGGIHFNEVKSRKDKCTYLQCAIRQAVIDGKKGIYWLTPEEFSHADRNKVS